MCVVPKLSAMHCIFLIKLKRSLCLWLLIVGNSNLRLKWSEWLKRGHLIISHPFRCRLGESQGAICIQLEILFKPEPQKALQDCYEMCLINHQISSIGKYIIRDNQDKCVLFSPFWPQPTRDSNKEILTLPLYCSVLQWPFDISIITISKYNFLWMIFRFNKGYIFYLEALLSIHHQQGPRLTRWASCFKTDFVTREYFPSSSGEMWQIVSCHIFWRICDKVPAVVFADGFFLRIPLDWGTMREGQGRAGQSKVTSKIRFLQSRFLHTPWMWFGGVDRQHKALVSRILQQNKVSLVFWPTEGHIWYGQKFRQ